MLTGADFDDLVTWQLLVTEAESCGSVQVLLPGIWYLIDVVESPSCGKYLRPELSNCRVVTQTADRHPACMVPRTLDLLRSFPGVGIACQFSVPNQVDENTYRCWYRRS